MTSIGDNLLTVRHITDILKVSERTVLRQIKSGKLSASKNEEGKWVIDKSEFYRAYPDHHPQATKGESDTPVKNMSDDLQKELTASLKQQIATLEEQLRLSNKEKESILETLQSNQRMLEHQAKPRRKVLGIF
jgi:predicted site-specific integrase-resolvase